MHVRLPGLITITVAAVLASVAFAVVSAMYPWAETQAATPVIREAASADNQPNECAESESSGELVCVDHSHDTDTDTTP